MAKLKIFTYPDTVLAQKAAPIARVEKAMHKLADDMLETMYYAPGIGNVLTIKPDTGKRTELISIVRN